jgi:hypothetical protein
MGDVYEKIRYNFQQTHSSLYQGNKHQPISRITYATILVRVDKCMDIPLSHFLTTHPPEGKLVRDARAECTNADAID